MNLENFPTSESAKQMLSYVSNHFYDNSYIAKWLYQVMGLEMDDTKRVYDELKQQIFPEDATWGIKYHELKYGISVNPDLSLEQRRINIITKRDARAPMNPEKIRIIAENITRKEVEIYENIKPFTFMLKILLKEGEFEIYKDNLVKTINRMKPAHISYYMQTQRIFNKTIYAGFIMQQSEIIDFNQIE